MNLTLALCVALLSQTPGAGKADEKLDLMKAAANSYRFSREASGDGLLTLQTEPAFRMGKQSADDVQDGAIFFWLGDGGRPEAAAQIFQVKNEREPNGLWIHEFISLSPGTFAGERKGRPTWSPQRPGVEFRPVSGAPKVAGSPAARLRQMRALAMEFQATDNFKDKNWSELRLLPTPIARYGKSGSEVADGALFAFALATDPEAFLFIEARPGPTGREWHYAFAPMTCFQLKGSHKGKVVWEIPYRKDAHDPTLPYFLTN